MEKEQSMEKMMKDSEQEFRKQFDPNQPSYHGGLQKPVPVGGQRVPESMTSMYPEGYDPNQPEEVPDYGPEFRQVQVNREVYQNLKRELAKLGPIVQGFLRHEATFKQKGDPTNQKHKKVYQQSIEKQLVNLKGIQDVLSAFISTLEEMDGEGKQTAKELNEVIHESSTRYDSKETLGNFNFKTKKLSTKVFANANKCLQKMKDIKKEYAKKKKEAEAAKKVEVEVQKKVEGEKKE